tara:strand:+ start:453 stop:608 length:156 start_codon:yes stop_codon:yes gene_type:complete
MSDSLKKEINLLKEEMDKREKKIRSKLDYLLSRIHKIEEKGDVFQKDTEKK